MSRCEIEKKINDNNTNSKTKKQKKTISNGISHDWPNKHQISNYTEANGKVQKLKKQN